MASGTTIKMMREEATCSICLELMTESVSIDCGHTFCCLCIIQILENQKKDSSSLENFHCPVCKAEFQEESIQPLEQLANLIDTIKKVEQEHLCEEHGGKLCVFCENDGQLICWRCEKTPQHEGHVTVLIEEETVTKLRKVDDECKTLKLYMEEQIKKWKKVIEHRRQKIQSDFRNLHAFLQEEEKSYLWRLEKEQENILTLLKNREVTLEKESRELKKHVLDLKRNDEGLAPSLLKDGTGTMDMKSVIFSTTPKAYYKNIETVCNVSELYFDMKKILERYQAIITLDPDTAHTVLHLSENGKHATCRSPQRKPDTPERFTVSPCVLGCQIFTSGRHYFEVSIPKGPEWDVGVCLENVPRDNDMTREPESGFWAIRLYKQNNYVALTSPPTPLHLREVAWFVGVFLDYKAGLVSFYNMYNGSHIFTFPKASFSEPLRPYFRIGKGSHLYLPSV